VFPANLSTPPLASSLNWRAGAPPTPNKVDVQLSSAGAIKLYNLAGKVDVVADVVGYYRPHTHDDRYYSKQQVDSMLIPRGLGHVRVIGIIPATIYWDMAFDGPHPGFLSARTPGGGVTCLKPDPAVLSITDVTGGFLTDASGNDTRSYFNGTGLSGCGDDEVVVMQKNNNSDLASNQAFNVLVP
jgi:hypothetical protein